MGHTQYFQRELLYKEIKKRIGPVRRCPFYNGNKYPQFDEKSHDVLNPQFPNPAVPIEEFDFVIKPNGKWGLQAYCKVCYKAYRDARIGKARETWVKKNGSPMKDNEIREWYRKNVGPVMKCSVCKRNLDPSKFAVSKSMEKGLHNECFECQAARGTSVRELEWLSDGDWDSWRRKVISIRRKRKVKCRGWSRSVEMGLCLGFDSGKKIHADHIIPLRAGGIHDAKNFQPLCDSCNSKKSDQIDPKTSIKTIIKFVGYPYKKFIKSKDTVPTVERKLKTALLKHIAYLINSGEYMDAIRAKKKEVNGQWNVSRVYRKGKEWVKRLVVDRS